MGKYFKYAIGEILLVVIGILIALQINNWSEQRKEDEKVVSLLKKIQRNIESDMTELQGLMEEYASRDSILQRIVFTKLTKEDYKDPKAHLLNNVLNSYEQINLKKNAYESLVSQQAIITQEYDSILDKLNTLYNDNWDFVNVSEQQFKEGVLEYNDWLYYEYDWPSQPIPLHMREGRIDYVLNEIKYIGMAIKYRGKAINNYVYFCLQFRERAIEVYRMIDEKIDTKRYESHLRKFVKLDSAYIGEYQMATGRQASIFMKNDLPYIKFNNTFMLHKFDSNKYVAHTNFLRFEKDGDSIKLYSPTYEAGRKPLAIKID